LLSLCEIFIKIVAFHLMQSIG